MAKRFLSFLGMAPRRARSSTSRTRERQRRARRAQRHRRSYEERVRRGVASGQPAVIRERARRAEQNRQRLTDDEIYFLAAMEHVRMDRPGHTPRLREGLLARLAKVGDEYWFLGRNGFYYKSTHRYGQGNDVDFVVNTYVPLGIIVFAQPYRQMINRR
ncbi:hypothetical protein F4804DRAFT_329176 [Jackrogersella minutella]|nr:hypothetical protein F4804DRAFT_329176 [Jackrogersella minutella]